GHRVQRDAGSQDKGLGRGGDHSEKGCSARRCGEKESPGLLSDGYSFLSLASVSDKSRNCFGSISLGDCDMRSMARLFFGNAITSRILCSPQTSMTRRSSPSAIPPCGGAPSRKARSKCPKSDCPSSGLTPSASNIFSCSSGS